MSTAQCSAIAKALTNAGLSHGQLAGKVNLSEQRVKDVLTGNAKPTQQEFQLIASALGLSNPPKHAAQVAV